MSASIENTWTALAPTAAYAPSGAQVGQRALRNACLGYLAEVAALERIAAIEGLAKDVAEVVGNAL